MRDIREIITRAKQRQLTIGTVESMTGGALVSALTSRSGASKVVKGGLVTYTNEEKEKLLDISHHLLKKRGAISEETALEMAKRGRYRLNVDVCVSLTGNAGPTASEGKPIGLFFLAIATAHETYVKQFEISGTRLQIRRFAVEQALKEINSTLKTML